MMVSEITTENGANARQFWWQKCISHFHMPVNKRMVMISTRNYFTIYQNLSSVNVSAGDKSFYQANHRKIEPIQMVARGFKIHDCQKHNYKPSSWLSN
jgi:hypothetical protein